MFDAKVDLSGFNRAFDGFEKMLRRPTDFMQRPAVDWMAQTEREQFDSEGAAGRSGRWAPLAPSTQRAKALDRSGVKILQRTGTMMNQLTRTESLRQYVEVTDDKIIFHLPPPAGFHQSGTRKMPQRKVVDPSDAQIGRLNDAVRREVLPLVRNLGFGAE
jgi:hypothetical protein